MPDQERSSVMLMLSFAFVFGTMSREWVQGGEGWSLGKGTGGLGRNWAVDRQHGTGVERSLQPRPEGHHP